MHVHVHVKQLVHVYMYMYMYMYNNITIVALMQKSPLVNPHQRTAVSMVQLAADLYDCTEPTSVANILESHGHVPLSLSVVRIKRVYEDTGHWYPHPSHVGIVVCDASL